MIKKNSRQKFHTIAFYVNVNFAHVFLQSVEIEIGYKIFKLLVGEET